MFLEYFLKITDENHNKNLVNRTIALNNLISNHISSKLFAINFATFVIEFIIAEISNYSVNENPIEKHKIGKEFLQNAIKA